MAFSGKTDIGLVHIAKTDENTNQATNKFAKTPPAKISNLFQNLADIKLSLA
jgi:hypothetical protein